MPTAIVRRVSPGMQACELTHQDRQEIDLPLAQRQHAAYTSALAQLGCKVIELAEDPALPDSVFVEDCAIVLDELAVITLPGAVSRRPEISNVAEALKPYRRLEYIQIPGTLDGGDILRLGRDIYIGQSTRSNPAALDQVRAYLAPYGYQVHGVTVTGCLHLKSAVTQLAANLLLLNSDWVDPALFPGWNWLAVHPEEPGGANALMVGEAVIYPEEYPLTTARMRAAGVPVISVAASEVIKAEGAVTCCSLVIP